MFPEFFQNSSIIPMSLAPLTGEFADTQEAVKVRIFREGHKILRNLHLTFNWHDIGQK